MLIQWAVVAFWRAVLHTQRGFFSPSLRRCWVMDTLWDEEGGLLSANRFKSNSGLLSFWSFWSPVSEFLSLTKRTVKAIRSPVLPNVFSEWDHVGFNKTETREWSLTQNVTSALARSETCYIAASSKASSCCGVCLLPSSNSQRVQSKTGRTQSVDLLLSDDDLAFYLILLKGEVEQNNMSSAATTQTEL